MAGNSNGVFNVYKKESGIGNVFYLDDLTNHKKLDAPILLGRINSIKSDLPFLYGAQAAEYALQSGYKLVQLTSDAPESVSNTVNTLSKKYARHKVDERLNLSDNDNSAISYENIRADAKSLTTEEFEMFAAAFNLKMKQMKKKVA